MVQFNLKVNTKTGLHARPAGILAKTSAKYQSEILVEKNGKPANAKSILGILSLAVVQYDSIVLKISGSDEQEASKELKGLFDNNFGER